MSHKTNSVNWFEIPVNDLSRAKKFYENVLQVELHEEKMGPMHMAWFPHEQNATGSGGTLVSGPGYVPSHQGTLVYFTVPSIEDAVARLSAAGGRVLMPKMDIGQWGFISHFEDCEGNRVALHAMK